MWTETFVVLNFRSCKSLWILAVESFEENFADS